jgi:hypothetical protein
MPGPTQPVPVKPTVPVSAPKPPVVAAPVAPKPVTATITPVVTAVSGIAKPTVVAAPIAPVVPVALATVVEPDPTDDGNIFVLGVSIHHLEPLPPPASVPAVAGRRVVSFGTPATAPGGFVNVVIDPATTLGDIAPINVWAAFVPLALVPPTPTVEFFFDPANVYGSAPGSAADAYGNLSLQIAGVKPSLDVYLCQLILEYPKGS